MLDTHLSFVSAELMRLMLSRAAKTVLFNEGNLLTLVLGAAERHPAVLRDRVNTSQWFREAIPRSPFKRPRGKTASKSDRKDPYEGDTKMDAAVGDFARRVETATGIELTSEGTTFIGIEAKLGSELSEDVTHADYWDQAARSVLCVADMAVQAGWPQRRQSRCLFQVFAPCEMIQAGAYKHALNKQLIVAKIRKRVAEFSPTKREEYERRCGAWISFIESDQTGVGEVCWESLIDAVQQYEPGYGDALLAFYEECKVCNRVAQRAAEIRRKRSRQNGGVTL